MSHALKMGQVPYLDVEQLTPLWGRSFGALVVTAMADAMGGSRPSVYAALRSREWADRWHDAVICASHDLAADVERMAYSGDDRQVRQQSLLGRVNTAVDESFSVLRRFRAEDHHNDPAVVRSYRASHVASMWLSEKYPDETQKCTEAVLADRGIPSRKPVHDVQPHDVIDQIETAVRSGWIDVPVPSRFNELKEMGDRDFGRVVGADAQKQDSREPMLRHPLMLNDWLAALHDIMEDTATLIDVHPDGTHVLPMDYQRLATMDSRDAYRLINGRRFYRACQQREHEWDLVVRRWTRRTIDAVNVLLAPWRDAAAQARAELARQHAEEYAAVLRALSYFLVSQGGDVLDRDRFTSQVRASVKGMVAGALVDGTWRRLLA